MLLSMPFTLQKIGRIGMKKFRRYGRIYYLALKNSPIFMENSFQKAMTWINIALAYDDERQRRFVKRERTPFSQPQHSTRSVINASYSNDNVDTNDNMGPGIYNEEELLRCSFSASKKALLVANSIDAQSSASAKNGNVAKSYALGYLGYLYEEEAKLFKEDKKNQEYSKPILGVGDNKANEEHFSSGSHEQKNPECLSEKSIKQDGSRVDAQSLPSVHEQDKLARTSQGAFFEKLILKKLENGLELTRRAIMAAKNAEAPESLYRWHWQMGRIFRLLGDEEKAIKCL